MSCHIIAHCTACPYCSQILYTELQYTTWYHQIHPVSCDITEWTHSSCYLRTHRLINLLTLLSPKPAKVSTVALANKRMRKYFKHVLASTCAVSYNVTFVVGEGNTYTDPAAAYTQSSQQLTASISTGNFTKKIQSTESLALQTSTASVCVTSNHIHCVSTFFSYT